MPSSTSLPLQLTSFIGRDREILEVQRLLGSTRLLTLTGAGGSGKTRLALQVATSIADRFADGVYFVNLAPITDAGLVIPTIARTLGVEEVAGTPLLNSLKGFLQDKHALVLLDNFEQVLEAAPLVVDVLVTAPDLKIMTTSREPLRLRGEQLYHVPPLDLPDPIGKRSFQELSQYEAIALFTQRSQAVNPHFELTAENAPVVAEICQRLDGLPLAIELAAARTGHLTPRSLLERLDTRLNLLAGGPRDAPARHQTLRNTMEWSYDLLSEGEQQLFRRMAVFQGGRTIEAMESVCNYDGYLHVDVLDGVASLVSKSLVQQRDDRKGEPRYWMLETIHEYAREKLQESGELEAMQNKHATYFGVLAKGAAPHLTGATQAECLNGIEVEYDNYHLALNWARERGERGDGGAASIGLRIVGALWQYWNMRGHYSEGRALLEEMITLSIISNDSSMSEEDMGQALHGAGWMAYRNGDFPSARSRLELSLGTFRALRKKLEIADVLRSLGTVASIHGDPDARTLYEESLSLCRELGDRQQIGASLNRLGDVAVAQGDYVRARTLYEESLAMARELDIKSGIGHMLGNLAMVDLLEGRYASARLRSEEGLALFRDLGATGGVAWLQLSLGNIAVLEGDYSAARSAFEESLKIAQQHGDQVKIMLGLLGLGATLTGLGAWQVGARLLGTSEALRGELGITLGEDDRLVFERSSHIIIAQLGDEAFSQALQEGYAMNRAQAIAYALEVGAEPECPAITTSSAGYHNALTRREVEVLRLVAQSLTNAQIAQHLFLSPATVNAHLTSIYSKLGVSGRNAATRFALEHNLG